ncbi:hypothetical protein AB1Y20_008315 [Prymnesium parvum]|uniref:DNA topoisomerase (ATP-hydrolyzing) n=1 Tax=Prymnesium parvum TaxID=97485 RepID=A0AB34IV42_PRYPA
MLSRGWWRRGAVRLPPLRPPVRRLGAATDAAPPPAELHPEKLYEHLTPVEHVLRRPAMYVGSVSSQTELAWALDAATARMAWRPLTYSPALFKVFDEILVNALDNKQRDPHGMTAIDISVDERSGRVSVSNTGRGIPVERRESGEAAGEGAWLPELLFGELFTGSNLDDSVKRTFGGRHGFGAKLTNIFSLEFEVETADRASGLHFVQRWRDNMSSRDEAVVTPIEKLTATMKAAVPADALNKKGGLLDFTRITFLPDFERLGCPFQEDIMALWRRRAVEAAFLASPATVRFNGKVIEVSNLRQLMQMYSGSTEQDTVVARLGRRWEVGVTVSPHDDFRHVSFVNGVATPRGGTHVEHVMTNLLAKARVDVPPPAPSPPLSPLPTPLMQVMPLLAKALKTSESSLSKTLVRRPALPLGRGDARRRVYILTRGACARRRMMVFINCLVDNPEFDAQAKEALTTPVRMMGGECVISSSLAQAVVKLPSFLNLVQTDKQGKDSTKLKSEVSKGASRANLGVTKLEDAEWAGTQRADRCTLILTEGDSAKALAVAGLEVVGREYYGVMPLRGKFINVRQCSPSKLQQNEELINLMKALGLRPGVNYTAQDGALVPPPHGKRLRYGRVMLMTDQDHDGSHIKGLLINLVHHFWPELLANNYLQEFVTPLLKAKHAQMKESEMAFFSLREYAAWRDALSPAEASSWRTKYYKGLGTSTPQEARAYFKDIQKHLVQFVQESEKAGELIDMAFSKTRVYDRREWMRIAAASSAVNEATAEAEVAHVLEKGMPERRRSFENFVERELVYFSIESTRRSLPCAIDGLKPSQRKVLYSCFLKKLFYNSPEIKVAQLASYCSEQTQYHHGEASLHSTIISMAQGFPGSNNVPLLEAVGQFGTRFTGGADAASPRYLYTKLSSVTPKLFPPEDAPVLEHATEDGELVEPHFFVPIIPVLLLNGSHGIGTGWSTDVLSYNPFDVIDNVEAHINGRPMKPMRPWYNGFTGEIAPKRPRATARKPSSEAGDLVDTTNSDTQSDGARDSVANWTTSGRAHWEDGCLHITELPVKKWTTAYKEWLIRHISASDSAWESFTEAHSERHVSFRLKPHEEKRNDLQNATEAQLLSSLKLRGTLSTVNMHAFGKDGELIHFTCPLQIIERHATTRLATYQARKRHQLRVLDDNLRLFESRKRFIGLILSKELPLGQPKRALVEELEKLGFAPGTTAGPYDHLINMPIHTLTEDHILDLEEKITKQRAAIVELEGTSEASIWQRELDDLRVSLSNLRQMDEAAG